MAQENNLLKQQKEYTQVKKIGIVLIYEPFVNQLNSLMLKNIYGILRKRKNKSSVGI
jgi:hypothetical protein